MCGQRYSEAMCALSLLNALVDSKLARHVIAILSRNCTAKKSEPKDEVATMRREFKFRKRMAFSGLGSLITVPLH